MKRKASKKKYNSLLENVKISDIAAEGKSIVRIDNMVVFVNYAIPDDEVDIRITKKRKNYLEGVVIKTITPAPKSQEPFCQHFGVCGGCKW